MAQKRFGIVLNNGKAISGAGVFLLLVTFLVFFPFAVAGLVSLTMRPVNFEAIATAVGLVVGPGLTTFGLGLLFLRLIRVPFLRPAHEVEGDDDRVERGPASNLLMNAALAAGEVGDGGVARTGGGKLWWFWRLLAVVMGVLLVAAGIKGLIEGNNKTLLLLGLGVASLVVAVSGRDATFKS